jgi:hypothetical protein
VSSSRLRRYLRRSPKVENFSGETATLLNISSLGQVYLGQKPLGNFRGIMASFRTCPMLD